VIGVVAAWLLKRGIADRWTRPIAWALLAVAVLGIGRLVWGVWISGHDRTVVAADRTDATVKTLNVTVGADREAGANMTARDAAEANQVQNLEENINAAHRNRTSALDALSDDGVRK
jgi:hypothetical protein